MTMSRRFNALDVEFWKMSVDVDDNENVHEARGMGYSVCRNSGFDEEILKS